MQSSELLKMSWFGYDVTPFPYYHLQGARSDTYFYRGYGSSHGSTIHGSNVEVTWEGRLG